MAANQKLNMKAEAAKTKKMKAQGTTFVVQGSSL